MLAKLLVDCHFEFEFEIAEEMLWKEAQLNMLQKEGIESEVAFNRSIKNKYNSGL